MQAFQDQLQLLQRQQERLQSLLNCIPIPAESNFKIQQLRLYHVGIQHKLSKSIQHFQSGILNYERNEQLLLMKARSLSKGSIVKKSNWEVGTLKRSNRFHTTFSKDRNLAKYLNNGACVGGYAGLYLARFKYQRKMKYASFLFDTKIGEGNISYDVSAHLFEDKKLKPSLNVELDAGLSALQSSVSVGIGNDKIRVDGSLKGVVGAVNAQAKAVISAKGFQVKAEVGAAALQGEIKGSISILGVKISATGSGEIAAIGGGAEFTSKVGEFEFGAKLSAIAGLGFKIKVDY